MCFFLFGYPKIDGYRSITWNINTVLCEFLYNVHVHRTYICLGGGGAFSQCHELKRTRSKENEKLPYLFRSRFNSLNDCRETVLCKCTCMNSHYPHKVPFCYLQSLWLRARDFGDIYLCNVCECVCVLYCAVFIGKFQLNRPIFERLFNFFSYCCSQFRSFFSNNWCVFAGYAEGPVTHWQLHPKTYLLPQQLHFADVLQAQNFSTPMNKTILRNICIYINSFK